MRSFPGRGGGASLRLSRVLAAGLSLFAGLTLFAGCTPKKADSDPLVAKGRQVYQANCIACHNPNPRLPGAVGPDLQGSSRELIEARVLRAGYPPGYSPKRATHLMAPLPHLKNELEALHAYLNSPAP